MVRRRKNTEHSDVRTEKVRELNVTQKESMFISKQLLFIEDFLLSINTLNIKQPPLHPVN